VFMTVLVGGSFLAIAVRPTRASPATVTLLVSLATWLVAAAAGLEWPLLGYAALLALQLPLVLLVPGREHVRPVAWPVSRPMLVLAVLGIVPWLLHPNGCSRATVGTPAS
jgi:hypothetical protein